MVGEEFGHFIYVHKIHKYIIAIHDENQGSLSISSGVAVIMTWLFTDYDLVSGLGPQI